MTAEEILDIAVDVERKAAVIYRLLYDRFKDDIMARYLFYSLSLEEERHAKFIEAEKKMLKTIPHVFGGLNVDASSLLDTLKKMETLETYIKENPITLERAINVALTIEEELVENKYADLIEIRSPSLKKIFGELTAKSDHVERLDIAAKKIGVKIPVNKFKYARTDCKVENSELISVGKGEER